jgi:hypothetical protein
MSSSESSVVEPSPTPTQTKPKTLLRSAEEKDRIEREENILGKP